MSKLVWHCCDVIVANSHLIPLEHFEHASKDALEKIKQWRDYTIYSDDSTEFDPSELVLYDRWAHPENHPFDNFIYLSELSYEEFQTKKREFRICLLNFEDNYVRALSKLKFIPYWVRSALEINLVRRNITKTRALLEKINLQLGELEKEN